MSSKSTLRGKREREREGEREREDRWGEIEEQSHEKDQFPRRGEEMNAKKRQNGREQKRVDKQLGARSAKLCAECHTENGRKSHLLTQYIDTG